MRPLFVLLALAPAFSSVAAAADSAGSWSPKNAAEYLDWRADWWATWKPALREQDTFCISCHTMLPYALGRPSLHAALHESSATAGEQRLIANVQKRVRMWSELAPLYPDEKSGKGKSVESRGTEAVINALVLTAYDAKSEDAKLALKNMWTFQLASGEKKGAFIWLQFHNEPWEGDDSQFWGATLAALAVSNTPKEYQASAKENIAMLADYLRREQAGESLQNRAVFLWAAAKMPGLVNAAEKKNIVDELFSKQQADGGWSASSLQLSTWKRKDSTELPKVSDGYGTALVSWVLEQAGVARTDARLRRGLAWLEANQDEGGQWPASSMNKQRDPASDAAKFMSDAATAFASMALTAK
ncbi:MAG TPA: hypothetical protein VMT15_11320 [Bryobacteraceae bacterium]|nr:hypothetical protein [Bryobacteraceae bacterium]